MNVFSQTYAKAVDAAELSAHLAHKSALVAMQFELRPHSPERTVRIHPQPLQNAAFAGSDALRCIRDIIDLLLLTHELNCSFARAIIALSSPNASSSLIELSSTPSERDRPTHQIVTHAIEQFVSVRLRVRNIDVCQGTPRFRLSFLLAASVTNAFKNCTFSCAVT